MRAVLVLAVLLLASLCVPPGGAATTPKPLRIALVDTGIDAAHPAFTLVTLTQRDF